VELASGAGERKACPAISGVGVRRSEELEPAVRRRSEGLRKPRSCMAQWILARVPGRVSDPLGRVEVSRVVVMVVVIVGAGGRVCPTSLIRVEFGGVGLLIRSTGRWVEAPEPSF
jgi:hypothetical protein